MEDVKGLEESWEALVARAFGAEHWGVNCGG